MEPFERHTADVGALQTCGAGLLMDAAEAIENKDLTSSRYQPAVESWDGMCAPELASARSPLFRSADDSHYALAWAAVVTQYWAERVETFNSEVDSVVERLNAQAPMYGLPATATAEELAEARNLAYSRARFQWWTAYNTYILDGEDTVTAMLQDGPTAEHLAAVADAGVLPPVPPGAITDLGYAGHPFNALAGALGGAALNHGRWSQIWGSNADMWRGMQAYHGAWANRHGLTAAGHFASFQDGRYWRGGHWRDLPNGGRTWVGGHWVARPGQAGSQARHLANHSLAQDAFRNRSQLAVTAGQHANTAASQSRVHAGAAGGFNTAATAVSRAGGALSFGTGAWDQWSQDTGRNDIGTGEQVARAATRGGMVAGGGAIGAKAGAGLGAAIGTAVFPGVGTVVGGAVGGLVGGAIGAGVADKAADAVMSGWDSVKGWFG